MSGHLMKEVIAVLSPHAIVHRDGKHVFVRYIIENDQQELIEKYSLAIHGRYTHTGALRVFYYYHKPGCSLVMDVQHWPSHTLDFYIVNMKNANDRVKATISVAQQIIGTLAYFSVVHAKSHRNIVPENVLVGPNGHIKLSIFNMITGNLVRLNPHLFTNTPYCAPEYRSNPARRLIGCEELDVWSLGVLLYSVATGKLMRYSTKMRYKDEDPIITPTEEELNTYNEQVKDFEIFRNTDDKDKLRQIIPDDLTYWLIKRCLKTDPIERIQLMELYAYIMIFIRIDEGGSSTINIYENNIIDQVKEILQISRGDNGIVSVTAIPPRLLKQLEILLRTELEKWKTYKETLEPYDYSKQLSIIICNRTLSQTKSLHRLISKFP